MKNKLLHSGFSLVEILVVLVILTIVSVVGTQIVATSLRNSSKSENLIEVRENVDYAFNVIERELRGASDPDCTVPTTITYLDQDGVSTDISCVVNGGQGSLQMNGIDITGNDLDIDCAAVPLFTCTTTATGVDVVTINISATDANNVGLEGAQISTSTQITLRSF